MADIKWIKIATDIFDDEKILLIEAMPDADAMIVIWFKLLTLAGKQNNSGVFLINDTIPYTDEMLATIFRRPLNTVRLALDTFYKFGMIDIIENTITIPKWEKHQNIDGMDKIREQTRLRVAKHREKQKLIESNVTVTQCNATDKDKDKNKSKNKKFIAPSIDEVREYIEEKGYSIDPERFVDYYTANGWMVGKSHMKDWKATVRNWERNNGNDTGASGRQSRGLRERSNDREGKNERVATGFIPMATDFSET
jgi:predicted phage replisome organizer